jgi:hypothetical protein
MIDSAISVLDLRINQLKTVEQSHTKYIRKSSLCLSESVDYIDIMEIACGLFYANIGQSILGGIVNFTDIVRIFEIGFNFEFADIYKKRDDVFVRKPLKRTEFLHKLIHAINTESKNRGYL